MGASPRGSLGLLLAARAYAVIGGRDYVTPEDVKAVAEPVLAHRITVKPEMWMSQVSGRTVVAAVLSSVAAPAPLEFVAEHPLTDLSRPSAERSAGTLSGAADPVWRPTVAYFRAAVGAVVIIMAALIGRRPDLLVIATPFAVVTAWSLLTRPSSPVTFDDRLEHSTIREGRRPPGTANSRAAPRSTSPSPRSTTTPWIDTPPVERRRDHRCRRRWRAASAIGLRSTRWGVAPDPDRVRRRRQPVGVVRLVDRDRLCIRLTTLPLTGPVRHRRIRPPSDGLVGLHRSARAGEGNEFAGIRPFRAGDRMRRINWPRSVRTGEPAGQLDVGRPRHPRRPDGRRDRRLRRQRGDRRPGLESRRGRARGRSDRRALRAPWRAGLAPHVRTGEDLLGTARNGARPAPPDPRHARSHDPGGLLAHRVQRFDGPAARTPSMRSWS